MIEEIKLKGLVAEDFINYKKPSMFLITSKCDWKCCKECGIPVSTCQNEGIAKNPTNTYTFKSIYDFYKRNDITQSVVIGGLEPFLQFEEIKGLISFFRNNNCQDDIVIYTGYYKDEIQEEIDQLKEYKNIIIKFGRFIPNRQSRYDDILGITLVSNNQYAEVVS